MKTPDHRSMALLILAAGASRRMGRAKALLPWHGSTVIAHHYQVLGNLPALDPWIVTQPDDADLTTELDAIGWPAEHRVINPKAPEADMLSSIKCGLNTILNAPKNYPSIGIALLDQLLTLTETYRLLADEARQHPAHILQPGHKGRRGHPVMLPRTLAQDLADYDGDSLRGFLEKNNDLRAVLPVEDAGVVTDMDTPEAYTKQLHSN